MKSKKGESSKNSGSGENRIITYEEEQHDFEDRIDKTRDSLKLD